MYQQTSGSYGNDNNQTNNDVEIRLDLSGPKHPTAEDLEAFYAAELPEGIGDAIALLDEIQPDRKWAKTAYGWKLIHPDYEVSGKAVYASQTEVAKAWREMKFPAHEMTRGNNAAMWNSGQSMMGRQNVDGSGRLMHHRTIAAIRTHNGLVINNDEDWAVGRYSYVSPAPRAHGELPLTSLDGFLQRGERLEDIMGIRAGSGVKLVEFSQGFGYVIGRDKTANVTRENTGRFAFRLDPEEMENIRVMEDALDLLTPTEVREAEAEGMSVYEGRPSLWALRRGNQIIRQGEWFFIPMDEDFEPEDVPIFKPLSQGVLTKTVDDVEQAPASFPAGNYEPTKVGAGLGIRDTDTGVTYYDGQILPLSFGFNHSPASALLGRHVPRDFAPIYDDDGETVIGGYVRGTVRHTWGDHPMINLRERWHRVVTHGREVASLARQGGRRRWD